MDLLPTLFEKNVRLGKVRRVSMNTRCSLLLCLLVNNLADDVWQSDKNIPF